MPQLPSPGRRLPVNTYRLQLTASFTFDDAAAQLDYLISLGVTDLYLSPILAAVPGSTHGYDVVDHSSISAHLGGRDGFERLARRAHALGLGVVVDIVPNHMAVPDPLWTNPALWSVLREGAASAYANWFDIPGDGSTLTDPRMVLTRLPGEAHALAADGRLRLGTLERPGQPTEPALWVDDTPYPLAPGTETLTVSQALSSQHYQLVEYSNGTPLAHRRFFDVSTLIGIRVERPEVFDATHALLLELLHAGHIDGFRVDHPDGLADPEQYFERLHAASGGAWVVAEKILIGPELLPRTWPAAGTTGYEASWRVNAVQLDPSAYEPLVALAADTDGTVPSTWHEAERQAKRLLADTTLAVDVARLANLVWRLEADVPGDPDDAQLRLCLRELLVGLDRYRAYVRPGSEPDAESLAALRHAADRATLQLPVALLPTLEWLGDLAALRQHADSGVGREFAVRFQQVSGALMAKGVEDTAFYRWTPLLTTCDVGGDPGRIGLAPDDLHAWITSVNATWPAMMTLGSTHDSKRSEDVRARIGVISEYPREWRSLVTHLAPTVAHLPGPIRTTVWQTLAGTWTTAGPLSADRLAGYLTKAGREQKLWTSWQQPDEAAEAAVAATVTELVLNPAVQSAFDGWLSLTADAVRTATLCTKAVQLTVLGVADTYQGTETVRLSLTDPDNRRPVDFQELRRLLDRADAETTSPAPLGAEKSRLTATILRLRRRHPASFVGAHANYLPLTSTTPFAWGFARGDGLDVVTIATRLHRRRTDAGGWQALDSVRLPPGTWRNLLTDATHRGDLRPLTDLGGWPCAVLERR